MWHSVSCLVELFLHRTDARILLAAMQNKLQTVQDMSCTKHTQITAVKCTNVREPNLPRTATTEYAQLATLAKISLHQVINNQVFLITHISVKVMRATLLLSVYSSILSSHYDTVLAVIPLCRHTLK